MTSPGPTRGGSDLADVVEMLLDKGVVINADIAVSIGDTQLLGVHLRAAIASFETAAKYGLAFPEGTDTERIEQIADMPQRSLHPAADDENGDAAPADGARHERRAVALRPSAGRPGGSAAVDPEDEPGGVGGVDATVVDLDADADDEASDATEADATAEGETADDADPSDDGETTDETADDEGAADDETTADDETADEESEEDES